MDSLWPWLAVAGLGALHGLNPTSGWMFAAAWGLREGSGARAWRALPPLAIGHACAIAVTSLLLSLGMSMDQGLFQQMAGALLLGLALHCLLQGTDRHRAFSRDAGHAGMALWSFLLGAAQGAGLMLLPAFAPMCLAGTGARPPPASIPLALAMVALHMAAMLLTTGVIASSLCRTQALRRRPVPAQAWPMALIVSAALLMLAG